ncbi:hypothetical protein FEDK69T_03410 [Flavobacterium enshiense DK69]|nr:hypothetical protein FEDK69T_03410 [Flavobacterium enshiense DK69]
MKTILRLFIWGLYLYFVINMLLSINSFWDFVWFIFIGSILLGIANVVLAFALSFINDK